MQILPLGDRLRYQLYLLMARVFLVWHGHLNCYQAKSQRPAYGMLGDVPAQFRDQHMAC